MSISTACHTVLKLSAIKGLGLKTFHFLYQEFGSVEAIVQAEFSQLQSLGIKSAICRSISKVSSGPSTAGTIDKILSWANQKNQYVLCLEDQDYPSQLKEIYCPPPVIYLKGQLSAFHLPSVAVVGSRKPSVSGIDHAFTFARDLSLSGLCINSGLAIGIDGAAHQGALQSDGVTCGVLATGLDIVYPKQHYSLAEQIIEKGALVSEMSLGALPIPSSFPRRNRIISGLSHGVLVVEASLKSGSLITANYALEQNREVYAIPGSIDNPVSAGCHALIKQGAQLVETASDILEEVSLGQSSFQIGSKPLSAIKSVQISDKIVVKQQQSSDINLYEHLLEPEKTVMHYVGFQCVSFDLLVHHTALPIHELTHLLVGLELKGELCCVPGGYQRSKPVNSLA